MVKPAGWKARLNEKPTALSLAALINEAVPTWELLAGTTCSALSNCLSQLPVPLWSTPPALLSPF